MSSARGRSPVAGWIVWSVRGTVTAHLVSVLAQAVLAGLFVTGDVDLLRMHSMNAGVASTLVTLQFVAAILLWRPGRGAVWPLWASLVLVMLEGIQHTTGFSRDLGLHFPLGMLIFGFSSAMAVWAWGRIERRADGPAGGVDAVRAVDGPAGANPSESPVSPAPAEENRARTASAEEGPVDAAGTGVSPARGGSRS
ncbi:hypothetical protein [Thermostaphylospora chromogena]|uniref:Uncharacterized protein n=1 Tax=Thermostaphylospora chromogena TaxID=35622 RepID=A0A1H1CPE5_9ACTN|nr:hypothetical protein [Thermostaphylospora chromogena]SDQ66111.1 hypothetical protein SAMN04489764_1579 [Thermostaphylospora chromogena]